MSTTKQELAALLTGEVLDQPEIIKHYSRDASLFDIKPKLVTYPQNVDDIKKLIKYVNDQNSQAPNSPLSLTVRSGGTDMTGGPLSESIIVDISQHLNQLELLTDSSVTAQPGLFYRDLAAAAQKQNLLLPSYPASKDICTIGGMVANNSGGEKTLTYGKTANYVKALKVVLHDGNEYTFSQLNRNELKQKMKLTNLEGDIYRRLFQLVDQNYELLQQAKPKVSKNSAGYNLWDVWDRDQHVFDLTKLFTGSQGTLGIITDITFRLITPQPYSQLLIIFLQNLTPLADLVQRLLSYQPESLESYDNHTLKMTLRYLPDLIKQLKAKNTLTLAVQFLPEFIMLATGGIPKLIILAEFSGTSQAEVRLRAQAASSALAQFNVKTRLARSPREANKYWVMRRESFNLLRHHVHHKRTAPFIDDLVVRPDQLTEFLPQLNKIMSRYDITYTIAGHIGDANFHIIPLMNLARPDAVKIIDELSRQVYDLVFKFHGSMTGEHNDGLIRSHYLEKMYGSKVYELFKQTKHIFDPDNIFNPGKKVNADWEYAKKHLIKK